MTWLLPIALMGATFLVVFAAIGWQAARLGPYAESMYTLDLSDEELRLLRAAIGSCVRNYGHDEADIRRAYQAMLARLPAPVAKVS